MNKRQTYEWLKDQVLEACQTGLDINIYELYLEQGQDELIEVVTEVLHDQIDNSCIYTLDCQQIIEDLDYDVFQDHPDFGRFDSYAQAAYAALYDLFYDKVDWQEDFVDPLAEAYRAEKKESILKSTLRDNLKF